MSDRLIVERHKIIEAIMRGEVVNADHLCSCGRLKSKDSKNVCRTCQIEMENAKWRD